MKCIPVSNTKRIEDEMLFRLAYASPLDLFAVFVTRSIRRCTELKTCLCGRDGVYMETIVWVNEGRCLFLIKWQSLVMVAVFVHP